MSAELPYEKTHGAGGRMVLCTAHPTALDSGLPCVACRQCCALCAATCALRSEMVEMRSRLSRLAAAR